MQSGSHKWFNLAVMRTACFCVLFFLVSSFSVFAQQTKNKKKGNGLPSYFGLQFKPLVPGDFLAKSEILVADGNFTGRFTQRFGYSFGGVMRFALTKQISLETGVNQVRRNYTIDFALPDSNAVAQSSLGIISYDIPLTAMVYIQLGKRVYTNASLGTAFTFFPSNVASTVIVDDKYLFVGEGRRSANMGMELSANWGFELRTEKNGFFYLGVSGKVPFQPIFKVAASFEYKNSVRNLGIGYLNGAYLSLDLRYFLPNIANKGQQFNQGPITQ